MSIVNSSAVAAALQKSFEDDVASQINRSTPVLQLMEVADAEGQSILFDARTGTATPDPAVSAIGEGNDVSVFNADTKTAAELQYTEYHNAFSVTGPALAKAMVAGAPQQLVNLFEFQAMEAGEQLAKILGSEIINGDGSTGSGGGARMIGLLGGALANSGTYAGIDRGSVTQWQGNVLANGGTPRALSRALMRQAKRRAETASGMSPTAVFCGPATHEQYGLTFEGERRQNLDAIRIPGRGPITLDGGYTALDFDGMPVISDINIPEGTMIFANPSPRFMRFMQLPQPGAAQGVNLSREEQLSAQLPNQLAKARLPIRVRVQPLAITGDYYRFAWFVYPQLEVRRPNGFTLLEDIAYTV